MNCRSAQILTLIVAFVFMLGCGSRNRLSSLYTYEDKTVFELLERLMKNANDKEAASQLPVAYKAAAEKRKEINLAYKEGSPGDRWMNVLNECQVMKQMYDAVKTNPAASKVLPDPWDPTATILRLKQKAAREYYDLGVQYLTNNNRESASTAYTYLYKANNIVPGFENVQQLLREAQEKSVINVIVSPVRYDQYNWNYWGFENDWLQQQMVRDLNAQSFRNVRFYTDWEASGGHIRGDRYVDLNFTELYVGSVYTDRSTYNRTAEIQTGTSKGIPPKPVYTTVRATVYVTRHYLQSRATLECRIYDRPTDRNILYDRFPDSYNWKVETATYRGDERALTNEDRRMIGNSGSMRPPGRNEVAGRLIRNCYSQLLNRIRNGVSF